MLSVRTVVALCLLGAALAGPQHNSAVNTAGLAAIHSALGGSAGGCLIAQGFDCVDLALCVDGVIDTTGAYSLDLRTPQEKIAQQFGYQICARQGPNVQVCCKDPEWVAPVGAVHGAGGGAVLGGGAHGGGAHGGGVLVDQCGKFEECVLKEYCEKGIIVTDGAGLLDLRQKYVYNRCIDPEYPNAEAVCCRPDTAPLVVDTCPLYEECTDFHSCDPEGYISTAQTFANQYTTGQECYKRVGFSALTGVCCKTSCPLDSSCIPEDLCFGNIQDSSYNFVPYSPNGNWNTCFLKGLSTPGVCCQNPPPTEPIPQTCGVSQYAAGNSLATRYKTPTVTKLEADFGEFPWQAIIFYSNYTFKCGASLISEKYLLTAAHCVRELPAGGYRVRVGEWQVNTFTEPYPYHDYDVAKITFHPQYRRGAEHNNIAVIQLASPVTLAYNVNTVCLPDGQTQFPPNTRCIVSGWGKDSFVGNYQHILKKIDVPLVDHALCQNLLRRTRLGRHFRLHDGFLCAGGEQGKDACTGDGGGPLVCLNQNNQYVLAGITSWGIGCGVKDVPGVYANVGKYVPWILQAIQGQPGVTYGR